MANLDNNKFHIFNKVICQEITGLLVLSGLILRVSIGIWGLLQKNIDPSIAFLFEGLTLLIIAILITVNRYNLAFYHIDRISMLLIIIGALLRVGFKDEPVFLSLLFFCGIAVWLLVVYKKIHILLKNISIIWLITGLTAGILLVFLLKIPFLITFHFPEPTNQLFISIIANFNYFLFHSAVLEEPFFRGFLWGYLQLKGWSVKKILLIQATLFWVVHINYISRPYVFWIVLPIAGIMFGILVWKSSSIAPVILAHAAYNDVLGIFF